MSKKVSLLLFTFFYLFNKDASASFTSCFDDFSQNRSCSWQEISYQRDFWQINNSLLVGSSHFFTTEVIIYYLTGDDNWTDYTIEADVKNTQGVDKTIIGRFKDRGHYYLLNLRSGFQNQGNDLILTKMCCSGHRKVLARVPYPNSADTWYRLRLDFVSKEIKAFVNDQLLIRAVDDFYPELPILKGKAGVITWGGNYGGFAPRTTTFFDNIRIKKFEDAEIYVLIPGFGASWNFAALSSCTLDITQGWSIAPYAGVYDRLKETFLNADLGSDKEFFAYPYDWR